MNVLNIEQSPTKVILDRFNARNALQLNHDDFVFSEVENIVNTELNTNASVTVNPKATSAGYNTFKIHYNKMDLSEVLNQINTKIVSNEATSLVEILTEINQVFGIYLLASDIEDATIVYTDEQDKTGRATVKVKAKEESYLFKGEYDLLLNEVQNPWDAPISDAAYALVTTHDHQVKNLDTSYSTLGYFSFLDGVEHTNVNIEVVIHEDKTTYFKGSFDLTNLSEDLSGQQGDGTYQGLRVNRVGKLIHVDKVARYEGVSKVANLYTHPTYKEHYYIDKDQSLQGSAANLYRFNSLGERDNTLLQNSFNTPVTALVVLDDDSFVVATEPIGAANQYIRITRHKRNGELAEGFNEIQLKDSFNQGFEVLEISPSYDSSFSLDGFYIYFKDTFGQKLYPVVNNEKVYPFVAGYSEKHEAILPILKFNLDGSLDTNFKPIYKQHHPDAFKPIIEANRIKQLYSDKDGLRFLARILNPLTKAPTLVLIRLNDKGEYTYPAIEYLKDLPYVLEPISSNHSAKTIFFLAKVLKSEQDNPLIQRYEAYAISEDSKVLGKYFSSDQAPTHLTVYKPQF